MDKKKKLDPQIIVRGKLCHGEKADVIVFSLPTFGLMEMTCIVTIPNEGEDVAPVYVKQRLDLSKNQPPGSVSFPPHDDGET